MFANCGHFKRKTSTKQTNTNMLAKFALFIVLFAALALAQNFKPSESLPGMC